MDNFTFEFFRKKLETMERTLIELKHEVRNMVASQQDLQDAIGAVGTAVEADAAQDQLVIAAIEKLIEKINASPAAPDFTSEVQALSAAVASLKGSNDSIQTELDKANA